MNGKISDLEQFSRLKKFASFQNYDAIVCDVSNYGDSPPS